MSRLLPEELARTLPALYSQEDQGENALAIVKFFTPWTNWTWYASEYDPTTRIFFGLVHGFEREYGYFSLDELEALRGPGRRMVERDPDWRPKRLADCGRGGEI